MSPELIKEAKTTIKNLKEENESLKEDLKLTKQAQSLAFNLLNQGAIVAEDLEEKIANFSKKSEEELQVFEKAAELASDPNNDFNLGTLSERAQDNGSLDPLTKMLITEL